MDLPPLGASCDVEEQVIWRSIIARPGYALQFTVNDTGAREQSWPKTPELATRKNGPKMAPGAVVAAIIPRDVLTKASDDSQGEISTPTYVRRGVALN